MEGVNMKDELISKLSDIFSDIRMANSLVDEGKEVHTSRRLQGVKAKILALMEEIRTSEEMETKTLNVASETDQTE